MQCDPALIMTEIEILESLQRLFNNHMCVEAGPEGTANIFFVDPSGKEKVVAIADPGQLLQEITYCNHWGPLLNIKAPAYPASYPCKLIVTN